MSETDKPTKAEDEYFARQELERRRQWAKENSAKMAAAEREQVKQAHYMKCPKCGMDLQALEYHGVSVDQCPNCGGIFFDKGEVEQLLEHEHHGSVLGRVFSIFK